MPYIAYRALELFISLLPSLKAESVAEVVAQAAETGTPGWPEMQATWPEPKQQGAQRLRPCKRPVEQWT